MRGFLQFLLAFVIGSTALQAAAAEPAPPPVSWTLQEAVAYALENNPDSQMATIKIDIAEARLDEAGSALLPRITLQGGYDQTNDPLASFGNILRQGSFSDDINFNSPGRTDNLRAKAEINYTLYNGGKTNAAITSSQFQRDTMQAEQTSVVNHLAFAVVRTFHRIIQSEEMVEAGESAVAAIQASLQVASARYEAGDLLREEVLNLEVQEARASENLIQARHALSLVRHAFNNLLGITGTETGTISRSGMEQEIPPFLDFSYRPELRAVELSMASAQADLDMVNAEKRPTVNGFAGYQYDYGFINDSHGDSWMAGVTVSYSLYDGHATAARIAQHKARLAELQTLKRKTELSLNFELQEAEQILQQAEERRIVTEKMVRLAEESARLSRARFKEGLILSSGLIDVETRLTDAQVRKSQAIAQYRTAIANLRKTVGLQQF